MTVNRGRRGGVIDQVDATPHRGQVNEAEISASNDAGVDIYNPDQIHAFNQNTCINQRPLVNVGDRIARGDVLADGPSTDIGELALGPEHAGRVHAVERLQLRRLDPDLRARGREEDRFTTIHIEELTCVARDTKLGPGEITADIPNVGRKALNEPRRGGIVYIGAEGAPGDILVGKITPKGESPADAGREAAARDLRRRLGREGHLAARAPGMDGTVIDVQVFTRDGIGRERARARSRRPRSKRVREGRDDQFRILERAIYRACAMHDLGKVGQRRNLLEEGRSTDLAGRMVKPTSGCRSG